jgi:hypothetical protein
MSPYAVIVARPHLAIHVREVGSSPPTSYDLIIFRAKNIWPEIRTVPILLAAPHPQFLQECIQALKLCRNLSALRCTVNMLPSLLNSLSDKPRLQTLRLNANLTTHGAVILTRLKGLTSVTVRTLHPFR